MWHKEIDLNWNLKKKKNKKFRGLNTNLGHKYIHISKLIFSTKYMFLISSS